MKSLLRFVALLVASGILSSYGLADSNAKPYTLQDLQALDNRKAWDELIVHLQDIPPGDRHAEWDQLVEHACLQPGNRDSGEVDYCMPLLKSVLEAEPQNKEFAMKAGQWARLNSAPWTAVPFFSKAILKSGDAQCKNVDVSLAVISGLGLSKDSNPEVVKQAQTLAFDLCWSALQDDVLKAFGDQGQYFHDNSCSALLAKNVLSGLRAKECHKS